MANTISNLLVGIGFDYDKQSADQVTSGIDSVKSKALQLGGVLLGAFGGNALTFGFASAADELGKFGQTYGVLAEDVKALGNVFRLQGGTLEAFMGQLSSIERMRAGLQAGDAGFIEAAGRAGLDVSELIQAEDALTGFLALADQFQGLTLQQRLNAAEALGLDDAAVRVLSQGRSEIEGQLIAQKELFTLTESMTDKAAEFNDSWQNALTAVEGMAAVVSEDLLPPITEALNGLTEFIQLSKTQGLLSTFSESVTEGLFGRGGSDMVGQGLTNVAASLGIQSAVEAQESLRRASSASASDYPDYGDGLVPVLPGQEIQVRSKTNVNLMLDGQVIDSRIVETTERMNAEALDALSTSDDR